MGESPTASLKEAEPLVSAEDDPDWGRLNTVANPERAGTNGSAAEPEQSETEETRMNSFPAERIFDDKEDATEPRGPRGGRGGRGGKGRKTPMWYYKDWSGEHGPKTMVQITKALQKGYFTPTLLVRKDGTNRWSTLRDVLDLRQALSARRSAAFKDEIHRGRGGRGGGGDEGRDPPKDTAIAPASPNPLSAVQKVDGELIAQLFRPGGPDWYYIDMEEQVQGPFKSLRMAKWWGNPQYREHFSTLKCRRGTTGPFQLLTKFSPLPDHLLQPVETNASSASAARGPRARGGQWANQQAEKVQAAEEMVQQLQARVDELELENEQLRQSNEDSFMLRMQVEQLCRDKATLAADVSQLRRDKEGLQELLQYAQNIADEDQYSEGLEDDLLLDGEVSPEEDEATKKWLEELRKRQTKDPGQEAPVAA